MGVPGSTADLEARLRRVEDREEVWRLIAAFRDGVDHRDFAAMGALFGESGRLVSNLGPAATGAAEIEALLEANLERHAAHERTYHHVGNTTIDVDGDTATAESTFAYIGRAADDSPVLGGVGRYSDRFTRASGRWRFAERDIRMEIPFDEVAAATATGEAA
jgi:ketosteroid isomerase-like protein